MSTNELQALAAEPTTGNAVAKIDLKALALSRFGSWREGAASLVEKYRNVVFADITTTKGYAAAKAALAEVRAPRFAAQNVAAESKSELAAVSKAVGAEQEAIAEFLRETEAHIKAQIDAEDERKKREKEERERKEAARKAKHLEGIAKIRNYLVLAAGMPAERVAKGVAFLESMALDAAAWEEFFDQAALARTETLEALRKMHADTLAAEQRAAEAEAQRLENERVAAELAEQRRQLDEEKARLAALQAPAPVPAPTPAPASELAGQREIATTASGLQADAATGELVNPPAPAPTPAPAPASVKPQAARTTDYVRRAAPPPIAPEVRGLSAEQSRQVAELGLRYGRLAPDTGEWIFTEKALAALIDYVRASEAVTT